MGITGAGGLRVAVRRRTTEMNDWERGKEGRTEAEGFFAPDAFLRFPLLELMQKTF